MPAKKDFTKWKATKGDHADDVTYKRTAPDPSTPPTDEQRTAAEVEDKKKK